MKIALASDHAGYMEKERLKPLLQELGLEVEDLGTVSEESVDYPDYARRVAERVARGEAEQGVLVCGSGTGMDGSTGYRRRARLLTRWCSDQSTTARYSMPSTS